MPKRATDIANTAWIDELSEEEEKVLKHSARVDLLMRHNKKIKIGISK